MTRPATDAPRVSDDEIIDSISTTYDFGWHDSDRAGENAKRGLDEHVVREISALKGEPGLVLNCTDSHTLRFLPPLTCTRENVDALIDGLTRLLENRA